MKQILFFLTVLFLSFTTLQSQTNTRLVSGNWNVNTTWSLGIVPTSAHDVVIPTGLAVTVNVAATVKSIELQGNSALTISSNLSFAEASTFHPDTTVNWTSGTLSGGGTLTAEGIINQTTVSSKIISGTTTLNNEGLINVIDNGVWYISNSVVDNYGTIDIQANNNQITYTSSTSHILNNYGLIKKTAAEGSTTISAQLINHDGTLLVEAGTLILNNAETTLNSGIYDVSEDAVLNWASIVLANGTLSGELTGTINWSGTVSVAEDTTTIFDFTGPNAVSWTGGTLSGGGTLQNLSKINLTTVSSKFISETTTLNNEGLINVISNGVWYISNSVVNNLSSGTIDIQTDNNQITYTSSSSHVLNNYGLIKKTAAEGNTTISAQLINHDGTLLVETGTLILDNAEITLNSGTYNVSEGAVLNWTSIVLVNGTLSGELTGTINWSGTVSVADETTFSFTGSNAVSWTSGTLSGGGTLQNLSKINLTTVSSKHITGTTTLNNEGLINVISNGVWYISNSVVDNYGIIDIQANNNQITYTSSSSHVLNNYGLIKKTAAEGNTTISAQLINHDGTLLVETGTLILSNAETTLNSGIYDVSEGAVLNWASIVLANGTLSGELTGTINWSGTVSVADETTFSFTGSNAVSWTGGTLNGGGTLQNLSKINLTTVSSKHITGTTTLNNEGLINVISNGVWNISNSVVDNYGTIDIQANNNQITYTSSSSHVLNNYGLIKKTAAEGSTTISAQLINHDGTLLVETGTLILNNAETTLNSGIYDVSEDAVLSWASTVLVSGALTGELTGTINWSGIVSVVEDTTAIFDFTGSNAVNWTAGTLNGGGTLQNLSKINLTTVSSKFITGTTTLNNEGLINVIDNGVWYLINSAINNLSSGTIDIQANNNQITYTSSTSHILNNYGLIKKTTAEGTATIVVTTNNSGEIQILSGTLRFTESLNNTEDGIVTGNAILHLPTSNFTNNGTFSPGVAAPATLTVIGNYTSTENTVLEIDINGLTQGTDYDLLAIQGNAVMNGSVAVNLGFDAAIGDEFIVSILTGNITQCELNPVAVAEFNDYTYTFDVECINDNSVILRVINVKLSIDEITDNSFKVYPNPVTDILQIVNKSSMQIKNVTIYDVSGRVLQVIDLSNGATHISLEAYASGNYFIKIDAANGSIVKQVIKK